jgi:hypothetical protein
MTDSFRSSIVFSKISFSPMRTCTETRPKRRASSRPWRRRQSQFHDQLTLRASLSKGQSETVKACTTLDARNPPFFLCSEWAHRAPSPNQKLKFPVVAGDEIESQRTFRTAWNHRQTPSPGPRWPTRCWRCHIPPVPFDRKAVDCFLPQETQGRFAVNSSSNGQRSNSENRFQRTHHAGSARARQRYASLLFPLCVCLQLRHICDCSVRPPIVVACRWSRSVESGHHSGACDRAQSGPGQSGCGGCELHRHVPAQRHVSRQTAAHFGPRSSRCGGSCRVRACNYHPPLCFIERPKSAHFVLIFVMAFKFGGERVQSRIARGVLR